MVPMKVTVTPKSRLFLSLKMTREKPHGNPRLAVLNADDQSYAHLNGLVTERKYSYSIEGKGDIFASGIKNSAEGGGLFHPV